MAGSAVSAVELLQAVLVFEVHSQHLLLQLLLPNPELADIQEASVHPMARLLWQLEEHSGR